MTSAAVPAVRHPVSDLPRSLSAASLLHPLFLPRPDAYIIAQLPHSVASDSRTKQGDSRRIQGKTGSTPSQEVLIFCSDH